MSNLYEVTVNLDGNVFYMNPINSDVLVPQFLTSKRPVKMTAAMADMAVKAAVEKVNYQATFCGIQVDAVSCVCKRPV